MTLVKICGIRDPETALLTVAAGADMIGLVFYPKSPRYVTVEQAKEIVAVLRESGAETKAIGLTVNMPTDEIVRLVREAWLDGVQLSGDETPQQILDLRKSLHHAQLQTQIFKSLRLLPDQTEDEALHLVESFNRVLNDTTILLDTYHEGQYGGTGAINDWELAARIAAEFPIILAGGLTPDNVRDAIRKVRPFGVDVSSGVEKAKGIKDTGLIRAFIAVATGVIHAAH